MYSERPPAPRLWLALLGLMASVCAPAAQAAIHATADWTFNNNLDGSKVGYDVETAGDVNGDGYSDVIVSAPGYSNGQSSEGRVWLFLGTPTGLSNSAAWSKEGGQTLANFGDDIAPAGDVNGDGYDDVIIGSYEWSNDDQFEGRAVVYHGSASGLSANPNWQVEGNGPSFWMGAAVGTAGDVNGDGYADVIVAANNYSGAQTSEGKVFVYLGSASGLSTVPAWSKEGNVASGRFGSSVSTAGDVNGDGYDDIVIGAWMWESGQSDEGAAWLYLGSASGPSNSYLWRLEGGTAGLAFGQKVACAGDVNGDGYSDIAISGGNGNPSYVWIYNGSAAGTDDIFDRQYTATSNSGLGRGMFAAGDTNGDGYSDLIIGDESADSGNPGNGSEGAAYLYEGGPSGLPTSASSTVWGEEVDSGTYGRACATAGDVNGDGFADVIVGDWAFDNDNAGNEGKAYLYEGAPSQNEGSVDWYDEVNQAGAAFGISCASGDWNADGYSDLAVGAWQYDAGSTNEGAAYVYYGARTGISTVASWSADSDQDGASYGYALATAGDVNGDGYEDLLVGAPVYDNPEPNEGRVWLYPGSSSGLATGAAWRGDSNEADAWYGWSVSSAGDVNGDGYSDVIIGVPKWDGTGPADQGIAYLYLGSASGLSTTHSWFYMGGEVNANLGFSVGCAGDVNGDGYSDVIVGVPNRSNGQTDEGIAYVFFGRASGLPSTPNAILQSNQSGSNFGLSVAGAGDVNADGYGDVIVGASGWSNGATGEGAAFVYHGSAAGLSTIAAWSVEGGQTGAHRGEDVGTAGDVNNDGYSDVVVGTPYYTTTLTDEGRTTVWFGGASGLAASTGWYVNGEQPNARMGAAVCSAGDINGDGFADIAMGAPDYDNGSDGEGRAFLYLGNEVGLDRAVNQLLSNGTSKISLFGMSDASNTVRLSGYARTAMGRGRVRLNVLATNAGHPFPTGMPNTDGVWYDTGTPVAGLGSRTFMTTGLLGQLEDDNAWHWQLRWKSDSPYFPWTPWFSPARGAKTETDFRTPPNTTDVPLTESTGPSIRFARIGPNPFVESTTMHFVIPVAGPVSLAVYDPQGRRVATLVDGAVEAGEHTVSWDGRTESGARAASGIYFARLSGGGREQARKIVLSK